MASSNISHEICDLSSNLLTKEGNNSYNFRIIEYTNRNGQKARKFGISQFWWCEKSSRSYPLKKNHVFLPLDVWPKLVAIGNSQVQQHSFTPQNGEQQLGHPESGYASVEPSTSVQQQPATRRRGRPPKCADEHVNTGSNVKAVASSGAQELDQRERKADGVSTDDDPEADTQAKKLRLDAPVAVSKESDGVGLVADDERTMPLFNHQGN
jgi:hypothetical protein